MNDAEIRVMSEIRRASENGSSWLQFSGLRFARLPDALADLPGLRILSIRDNPALHDIGALRHCPELEDLDLRGCPLVGDLRVLDACRKLKVLKLGRYLAADFYSKTPPEDRVSEISDLRGLESLLELEKLWIHGCRRLSDLSALAGLTGLRSLDLRYCPGIDDLTPLAGLDGLEELGLVEIDRLANLQPLAGLRGLERLDLSGSGAITDLAPLAGLTALASLDVAGCTGIADLGPLAGLTRLRSLDLSNFTRVTDLQALAGLQSLESLTLDGCTGIGDLRPLSALAGLTRLSLKDGAALGCRPGGLPLAGLASLTALYCNRLTDAPQELASSDYGDNALPRIRAWQQDLQAGEAEHGRMKVFVLGNGRVGKTQICRRLRGERYDDRVPSTHGIDLGHALLAAATAEHPAVEAQLWDFGGQQLYLGTHALFLDSRAIYVIAWTPDSENGHEAADDGEPMPHRPLAYWLDYVRAVAGTDAPVIVVQARCDRESDVEPPPLPPEHGFRRLKPTACSALRDRLDELRAMLGSFARLQLELYGRTALPRSWLAVEDALSARRDDKVLSHAGFVELCRAHRICAPETLLGYLHRNGRIFHSAHAFGGDLVLDLDWALAGLYALFDRKGPTLAMIRRQRGVFDAALLAQLDWKDYRPSERKVFLSMMEQCGIAFRITPDLHVVPELLPPANATEAQIDSLWRDARPDAAVRLDYAFLHEGMMRELLCGIGWRAGAMAVYWTWGVCFYDRGSNATARVRARPAAADAGAGRGDILIETAGPGAAALAASLADSVRRSIRMGRPPEASWTTGAPPDACGQAPRQAFGDLDPAAPPAPDGVRLVHVSYAWGGDSERLVDEVERSLPQGVGLVRDRRRMRPGDWVSGFMREIGRAETVLVVLSRRYLRSLYCLRELMYMYYHSQGEKTDFTGRVVPVTVDDLDLSPGRQRERHVAHLARECRKLETRLLRAGPASVSDDARSALAQLKHLQDTLEPMLDWMGDMLRPAAVFRPDGVDAREVVDALARRASPAPDR